MCKENKLSTAMVYVLFLSLIALSSGVAYADKPIVTDEFDRRLVTKETMIGDKLGRPIRLVFDNPL